MANTVVVRILGDADKLSAAFGQAEKDAQSFGDRLSQKMASVGKSMQNVGKKMTVGLTLPIAAGATAAFRAASDMSESMSKVGVVFGESAGSIERWSKDAAKSLGISRQEALEAAGTYGNLFKAMGVGNLEAGHLSASLVTLASDLGSFNNANPQDVLESLRAGLLGEAEPMRKFGVSLSAVRIEAQALAMGLAAPVQNMAKIDAANIAVRKSTEALAKAEAEFGKESTQAADARNKVALAEQGLAKAMEGSKVTLTAAQKAQAAYAIIMEDTKLAQGDFARTSDGAANQQRIMAAQFKDTAAVLGTQLLPIGTKIIGWASDMAQKFGGMSQESQKFVLIGGAVLAALGPVVGIFGTLSRVIGGVVDAIGSTADAISKHGGKFLDFGGKAIRGAGDVASAAGRAASATASWAASSAKATGALIADVAKTAASFVANTAKAIASVVVAAAAHVVQWGIMAASALAGAAAVAAAWLISIAPIAVIIAAIAGVVALVIIHWDTIKRWTAAAWDFVVDRIAGAWEWIKGAVSAGVDFLRNLFLNFTPLGLFIQHFDTLVGFVRGLPGRIANAASGLFDGIKDAFRSAINWIIRAWNRLEFRVPSIDLPLLGKVGGFTLGMPNIPQLAAGGVVTGPTLAMLGEASRPEAVIPLDRYDFGGGGNSVTLINYAPIWSERELEDLIVRTIEGRFARGGSLTDGRGGTLAPSA